MNKTLFASLIVASSVAIGGCSSSDDSSTPADTGSADAGDAGSTLYTRLGGNAGIKTAIDAIVADELKDPEIAAFFSQNDGTHAGHPSAGQIKECLVLLLGNASGGPEKYPGTVSGSFTCRSMKDAHGDSHIPATSFDKFVSIAAATLKKAGVSDSDIGIIGGVLNGTKTDVVDPTATTSDAGTTDGGSGG